MDGLNDRRRMHLFDISLAMLSETQDAVRTQLIEAQLREWPDSLILAHDEMLKRWLNFDKVPYLQTRKEWEKENATWFDSTEKYQMLREYGHYVDQTRARYKEQVLLSIAIAHQHKCVVFYECGKREDGTYRWRGARYGIEGHQYASGFGAF